MTGKAACAESARDQLQELLLKGGRFSCAAIAALAYINESPGSCSEGCGWSQEVIDSGLWVGYWRSP